jgi:tetratricopeptide (TPR) repeat protein
MENIIMLVTCPDCKKQISSLASACPNCGHPGPFAQENSADRAIAPANNETAPEKPMDDMPTELEWDKKTLLANLRRIYFARFMMIVNVFVLASAVYYYYDLRGGYSGGMWVWLATFIFKFSVVAIANLIAIYFTSRSVVISTYEKSEKYFKIAFAIQVLIVVALIVIAYTTRIKNLGFALAEDLLMIGGSFFAIAILSYVLASLCAAVRIQSPALLSSVRKRKSAPGNVGKQKTFEIIGMSVAGLLMGFGFWWFYVYTEMTPKEYFEQGQAAEKQKKWKEAITLYTQAIEIDPKFAEAYAGRSWAYYVGTEDEDSAKKDARIACNFGECTVQNLFETMGVISRNANAIVTKCRDHPEIKEECEGLGL